MSRERRQSGLLARAAAWLLCITLFVVSVPWYFAPGTQPQLWFGLPDWVVISLAACVAIAVTTAWMIHRFWPPAEPDDSSQDED